MWRIHTERAKRAAPCGLTVGVHNLDANLRMCATVGGQDRRRGIVFRPHRSTAEVDVARQASDFGAFRVAHDGHELARPFWYIDSAPLAERDGMRAILSGSIE